MYFDSHFIFRRKIVTDDREFLDNEILLRAFYEVDSSVLKYVNRAILHENRTTNNEYSQCFDEIVTKLSIFLLIFRYLTTIIC